jgi:hypothetical protein
MMGKHTIEIRVHVEGEENKVVIDGMDLSKGKVKHLTLTWDAVRGQWEYEILSYTLEEKG